MDGLNVGDKVIISTDYYDSRTNMAGKIGTIKSVETYSYGIEFYEDVNGHDLDCTVNCGYGWFVSKKICATNTIKSSKRILLRSKRMEAH